MAASDLVNLSGLLDDAKCYALVREHRWPGGVRCPACKSGAVILAKPEVALVGFRGGRPGGAAGGYLV